MRVRHLASAGKRSEVAQRQAAMAGGGRCVLLRARLRSCHLRPLHVGPIYLQSQFGILLVFVSSSA